MKKLVAIIVCLIVSFIVSGILLFLFGVFFCGGFFAYLKGGEFILLVSQNSWYILYSLLLYFLMVLAFLFALLFSILPFYCSFCLYNSIMTEEYFFGLNFRFIDKVISILMPVFVLLGFYFVYGHILWPIEFPTSLLTFLLDKLVEFGNWLR